MNSLLYWTSFAAQAGTFAFAFLAAIAWLRASDDKLTQFETDENESANFRVEVIEETLRSWSIQVNEQSRLNAIAARLTALAALFQGIASGFALEAGLTGYVDYLIGGAGVIVAFLFVLLIFKRLYERR